MKVTLPQTAIDLLKEIIKESADLPSTIRVYFAGFGCCGASFGIALDRKIEEDIECEVEGLIFIMNKEDYEKYGDVIITQVEDGFVISVEKMPEGGGDCSSCSGCH